MPSPITQAVLLVGGKGTRLRPLTWHCPKALVPLLNRPLLSYELSLMARHGITDVILAVGYKADALRESLGDGSKYGLRLTYVEDPEPRGTAGAIKNVAEHIHGHFIAMNGDLVYDVDLAQMAQAHLDAEASITFCLRRVEDISRYGLIQCDSAGWVTAFKEKQEADETRRNTVNSGLYVMSPQVLESIPGDRPYSSETELFPSLLDSDGKLLGYVPESQGYWADVGTIASYLETSRDLLHGAIPWVSPAVSADACICDGALIDEATHIAENVTVESAATVGAGVTVGPGCRIGERSQIRDSILWERAEIGRDCEIANTVVSAGVVIPDGSRLDGEVMSQ